MKVFAAVRKIKYGICRKMDTVGNPYVKKHMPKSKREILHAFSHMWNLDLQQCACVFVYICISVGHKTRKGIMSGEEEMARVVGSGACSGTQAIGNQRGPDWGQKRSSQSGGSKGHRTGKELSGAGCMKMGHITLCANLKN